MSETPRKPRPSTPSRGPRNPAEEAARLLRSPPVGSAVGDEPPAGIQHVKGGHTDGETLIVGQRLVRQVGPLFDLIRHKDTQMPLTAAIYGPWGSGKSTAMKWLDRMLECWSTGKDGQKSEGQKLIDAGKMDQSEFVQVRTVWFDPWKYQDRDDVLRGIIAEIIRETIKVQHSDVATVTNAVRLFGGMLGKTFLAGLESVKVSAGTGGTGVEVQPDKVVRGAVEAYKEANHPERPFVNDLEQTLSDWVQHTIPTNKRLVVFIDDLDRCQPRVALQVLEALKLYLRVPRTIFVVGVDRPVVASLVETMYQADGVREVDAHRYLAKMFQVEVTLDAEEDVAGDFFEHVTHEHDVWAMLEPMRQSRTLLCEYILEHADRNPREIKRLFNGVMIAAVGHLHDAGGSAHASKQEVARCLLQGARRFLIRHRLEHWRSGMAIAGQRATSDSDRAALSTLRSQYDACVHAIGTRFFTAFCSDWSQAIVDNDSQLDAKIREQVNFKPFVFLLDDRWLGRVVQLGVEPSGERDEPSKARVVVQPDPDKFVVHTPSAEPTGDTDPASGRRAILGAQIEALRTIRDAVALGVNQKPEDLTEDHLLTCTAIDLRGTSVTDLTPIAGLTGLERLYLAETGVTDLTPIVGLTGLQELDLDGTGVTDLTPIAGLAGLQWLDLGGTAVSDLAPIAKLRALGVLYLERTGVSKEQIAYIRKALPRCAIHL